MQVDDRGYDELREIREVYHRVCAEREVTEERCANIAIHRNTLMELARAVLDAHGYDEDSDELRALRQELWNDRDTEAKIASEGYDPS